MPLVAGVDSSTQSCKVVIRDVDSGETVRSGQAPHPPGTEVDPLAWEAAFVAAVNAAGGLDDVVALGIGGQQHGMICLDSGGNVVRPALLWNDTRSGAAADELVAELGAQRWATEVGTVPVAALTVAKLRWLARYEPQSMAETAAICLPHDWLTWRLRGVGIESLTTDRGDASGTGYWSGQTEKYCPDLLRVATGRDDFVLPAVARPDATIGTTRGDLPGVPAGLALSAGTGDNMAAALGLAAQATDVIVSVGTSGVVSVVATAPTADPTGLVAGFSDATGNYLPLACTLNAGQVLDAFRQLLGLDYATFDAAAQTADPGAGGLTLLPYLSGERTPNRPNARGVLSGIDLANLTPARLARSAVEAVAFSLGDGLAAVQACDVATDRILLVGGGAQLRSLQQCVASVFGVEVAVPEPAEYVANGAAVQAAWAWTGSLPDWSVRARSVTSVAPIGEAVARYAALRDATGPDGWPEQR